MTSEHAHAEAHLKGADPRLAELIERVGPCRLETKPVLKSTFAALAKSIAYQQLTGKAAATIFGRFAQAVGRVTPRRVLSVPFESLRACGLSNAKTLAIRDLAEKSLEGIVPPPRELERLDNELIIERVTQVRGIGRWTVEMLLIFGLGRMDVLPIHDYGVRKGFTRAFRKRKLVEPRELARHGQKWAPWRSVASWYLWRACEL